MASIVPPSFFNLVVVMTTTKTTRTAHKIKVAIPATKQILALKLFLGLLNCLNRFHELFLHPIIITPSTTTNFQNPSSNKNTAAKE